MFLYTIVPAQQIFYEDTKNTMEYKKIGHSLVQGSQKEGQFVVERLISTDPSLYLNPCYAPGKHM